MFGNNNDLGAALFKTWTEAERKNEIKKLVTGYRNGVPIGILCTMSETIAGSKKTAKKYLRQFMTETERTEAISAAEINIKPIVIEFLG